MATKAVRASALKNVDQPDLEERERAEELSECQRQALQRLAEGAPLDEVLVFLIRSAEQHAANGMMASVLLLNAAGTHFEHSVGPSLPPAFNQKVIGRSVSAGRGVGAQAILRRETVVAPDFCADPRWARFAEIVSQYGLCAGWATPIVGTGGRVLGAFANYYRCPCDPAPKERNWVEVVTRTAAIAIERALADRRLAAQRDILERIATGEPMAETLDELMRFLQAQEPGSRCGLLIVAEDGVHFRGGSGPNLPEALYRTLEGSLLTPPYQSSCGEAVHQRTAVVVPDVRSCTRYGNEWRKLLLEGGLLAVRSTPVRGPDGRVLASLGIYYDQPRDPTPMRPQLLEVGTHLASIALEHHQGEEQQARARRALEEADRQKDQFLAMLAHELRNPLAPIGIASELLARTIAENPKAESAIAMIKRQTAQLSRLVDDLLDVSRITQSRIQLRKRIVELAPLIGQAVETVEPQMSAKRHHVVVTTPDFGPLFVHADPVRLVQCLVNVLGNAAKYTEPGGEIRVRLLAEGASAVIKVADTGAGIAPELLPRIFDLFVQSDRTLDRAQGGLGIGLSVVKRLLEMHGGGVEAHSPGVGRGTTIVIRLPRVPAPAHKDSQPILMQAGPTRVLVVDDNVDAANSLAMLLGMQGHETRVSYSAKEALACIADFTPAVALLDLGLPEMNGYELARHLRAVPQLQDMRLVALTGYGQAEDRQRTKAAGFDDHLVKPVDIAALQRTLAGMVGAEQVE